MSCAVRELSFQGGELMIFKRSAQHMACDNRDETVMPIARAYMDVAETLKSSELSEPKKATP